MARRFKRQESWRLKRVKESWRRPRGGTSRIRLEISGWPRKPNIGFQKDSRTRGLHPSGLEERLVRQERDLDGIDPARHIVRLAHQIGEKKRLVLLEKTRQLKVRVANPGTHARELTPAKPGTIEEEEGSTQTPVEQETESIEESSIDTDAKQPGSDEEAAEKAERTTLREESEE